MSNSPIMVKEFVNQETKKEKFRRIAASRTQVVLDRIRILGNCANTYIYEYGEDDIKKIFAAIEKELKNTRSKFETRIERKFKL